MEMDTVENNNEKYREIYRGFELSPNYHKIAEERLETERLLMSQMELF